MKQPTLILLSGLPASGKTTIGDTLSQQLSIPLFTRDMFKEMMFDAFEWNDGGWAKDPAFFDKIGYVANSVLFKIISREMKAGRPVVIENAFHPHIYNKIFADMRAKTPFRVLQINVRADGDVLMARMDHRDESGQKHPGHGKAASYKFKELFAKGGIDPLDLPGKVITVDTTDWSAVDVPALTREVSAFLGQVSA